MRKRNDFLIHHQNGGFTKVSTMLRVHYLPVFGEGEIIMTWHGLFRENPLAFLLSIIALFSLAVNRS